MLDMRQAILALSAFAAAATLVPAALAEETEVILRGKVTMADGTPPPKSVGLERVCSDGQGSRPGPVTNSKGEYIWRMMVDPMRTRQCLIRATLAGHVSSEVNISNLNGYISRNQDMETLVLRPADSLSPRIINAAETGVPAKARNDWKAAMAALSAGDTGAMITHLQAAVAAEPKFARGWHALGVALENQGRIDEAREAYQKAIDADPKYLEPYVTAGQLAIQASEWQKAIDLSQALIKNDKKHVYPDAYLHIAIARFYLKDLAAAEAAAREALDPKQDTKALRAEYVLGRIRAAQGDLDGARGHIERYLLLKPDARDAAEIRASLAALGQAGAAEPSLLGPF
jgi:tetratricopeptide (TPR) repeat protein